MSRSPAQLLAAFHEVFDLHRRDTPELPPADVAAVRMSLLEEEVREVAEAVRRERLDEIAHELADVVYIAYGTAITYGIDLDSVIAEVHRANMSKLGADGQPIYREDGKVLKSDQFRPADVAAVLRRQMADAEPSDAR
jgi:predicted HAD superfamily Cof-like phosphohydrolase